MKRLKAPALITAWIVSLVGVALWAQANPQSPPPAAPVQRGQAGPAQVVGPGMPYGPIISGADIGFQRVGTGVPIPNGKLVGKLMVRVNGEWMEAQSPMSVVR